MARYAAQLDQLSKLLAGEISDWLDHRRRTASLLRKPGTLEELATRRGRMNPRLSHEWLGYLAGPGKALEQVE